MYFMFSFTPIVFGEGAFQPIQTGEEAFEDPLTVKAYNFVII